MSEGRCANKWSGSRSGSEPMSGSQTCSSFEKSSVVRSHHQLLLNIILGRIRILLGKVFHRMFPKVGANEVEPRKWRKGPIIEFPELTLRWVLTFGNQVSMVETERKWWWQRVWWDCQEEWTLMFPLDGAQREVGSNVYHWTAVPECHQTSPSLENPLVPHILSQTVWHKSDEAGK